MIDAKSPRSLILGSWEGLCRRGTAFSGKNSRLADPEVQLPEAIQPAMRGTGFCGEMADPIEQEGRGAMRSSRAISIHVTGRSTEVMPSWRALAFAAGLGLAASSQPGYATQAGSVQTVQSLYDALVGTMKNGRILGQIGRFAQLEPVIHRSFDIAAMARLSVGPSWAGLSEAQRKQMTESFERYISAIYSDRFDSYDGQKLEVIGEQSAPSGVMVRSRIIKANGEPVNLDYMMRRNGDSWLISDIYLAGAISEVATRRSEFSTILKKDGIDGLIAALNRKADMLTGGAAEATPPFARMLEKGVHVSGGTDATRVASYNPWISLAWLVTGKTVGGLRIYPRRNCLDREAALRLWTENVTWFSNEEGRKGRIEAGQLADFIVPDRDYFSCAEDEIANTTSDLTIVGGKIVYGAGDFLQLDEAAPPPAMPDWSPVRSFGGYAAWSDPKRANPSGLQKITLSCSCAKNCDTIYIGVGKKSIGFRLNR